MNSVADRISASLRTPPYRFQIRGVRFLETANGRGLIADDMGLGKSFQTIAWLALHPEALPAVVVCPATLKYGWQREFWTHARMEAEVAEGRRVDPLDGKIWILNYDILPFWLGWLKSKGLKTLVLDEVQKCKNRQAKRTRACKSLAPRCQNVIGLSGTPITNGPVEFFPILNMIAPDKFPSFTDYAFRFCNPKPGFGGHWDFRGASNLEELHELVAPYMIRRLKSEVLPDLPPVTRTVIPIKIDLREYMRAKQHFVEWLLETEGGEAVKRADKAQVLVQMGKLKRLAGVGKLPAVIEWVKDWLEDRPGEKLVVFGIHKSVIAMLEMSFPKISVSVTGDVGLRARQQAVDRFQSDPSCLLFFGNIRAAGEGLTLVESSTTATVELDWVPASHDQAEARVARIGQKSKHVDAFYFIAKGTIEEKIWDIQNAKRGVVGEILDGKKPTESDYLSVLVQDILDSTKPKKRK
jgi:SWI/SNF-related matrix-associated actin-dependent regulator of chromatin subfamily A-like protein 1